MRSTERVTEAAIRLLNGTVLTGPSHWQIMSDELDRWPEGVWTSAVDGFVTDRGRFVTREEAAAIVGCREGQGFMAEGLWALDEELAADVAEYGCACLEHINTPTGRQSEIELYR